MGPVIIRLFISDPPLPPPPAPPVCVVYLRWCLCVSSKANKYELKRCIFYLSLGREVFLYFGIGGLLLGNHFFFVVAFNGLELDEELQKIQPICSSSFSFLVNF